MAENSDQQLRTARQELIASLEAQGIEGIPEAWFAKPTAVVTPTLSAPVAIASNEMAPETTEQTDKLWQTLEQTALECRKCRLCEGRNKVVFGVGNRARPKICFIGEGPGADEDQQGEPFVGRAGKLLTAAITKGMGLRREDVYICNIVKCRPPENRAPLPDEVAACFPYLEQQIDLLKPDVIVTLGQPAQLALSGVNLGITKLRGQWQEWRGVPLMPTLHPAYLLRTPSAKKNFWEDLQAVMEKVGIPRPKREQELL